MDKDYRIGLVVGSVLAGIALIWVATRPSLTRRSLPAPPSPEASPASETDKPMLDAPERAEDETQRAQSTGPKRISDLQSSLVRVPAFSPSDLAVRDAGEPAQTTRVHTVRPGDTLSAIAQQYYGTSTLWRQILEANKSIKDANRIAPGTKLIIPDDERSAPTRVLPKILSQ